jgi:hypothetical protein
MLTFQDTFGGGNIMKNQAVNFFSSRFRRIATFSLLLPAIFFLSATNSPAHAQSADIQMLPPLQGVGPVQGVTHTCAAGGNKVLTWDGASPIGCASGVSIDSNNDLSVSGTVSGKIGSFSTDITIGGSTATKQTVDTANTFADFIKACAAAGGGIASIDDKGKLVCGAAPGPKGAVTYSKTVSFSGPGFSNQINNAVAQGTYYYYAGGASPLTAATWRATCHMTGDGDGAGYNGITSSPACLKFICEGVDGPIGGSPNGWPVLAQYAGGCPYTPPSLAGDSGCDTAYNLSITCFNSQ